MNRRRFVTAGGAAGLLAVTGLGAAALAASDDSPPSSDSSATSPSDGDVAVEAVGTATARVDRRTLSESKEFSAAVDYGDAFELPLQRTGTVTARPDAGTVVGFGDELVRVDLKPTFLAEGPLPMYRELKTTPDVRKKGQRYMVGYDVGQLQQFLIDAGFDADGELVVDGEYGPVTEDAVEDWQEANGLEKTGRVDSTQLLFSSGPLRLESVPRVGSPFSPIQATDPEQELTFSVDSRDRGLVAVDDTVEIATPDGSTTTGRITALDRTIGDDGSPRVTATIVPDDLLPPDVTTATVTATRVIADDVLAVPVTALLAVREGGFALERPGDPRLVRAEVGSVADGWVEIDADVAEGDEVVIAQ